MRPEFLVPDEFSREMVQDVLALVSVQVHMDAINRWTRFELIVAYDWAWRRHLVASDHPRRLLRDKPHFVQAAQDGARIAAELRGTANRRDLMKNVTRTDSAP